MQRKRGETPEIFVASEFFSKEPQRRASEAMRRDHAQYTAVFKKPTEERSEEDVRRVGDIIVEAPWFGQNFAHLRADGTTEAEQARDLARLIFLVTYEPVGNEPPQLCTKGEPVESFDVIVNGSVQVTDDALVMTEAAGSRAQILHGGQWFGSEALVPPDPVGSRVVNESSSNVRSTSVRLSLLRLLRDDHLQLLEVQKARQHQLYADLLCNLPMLKHYSCRGRTELATAFSHARFADNEVIVKDAAASKTFYVLVQGSVKVRKTLSVAPGLSYPVDLKVLHEGDIFGGDRFSTRMPVFENLSFIAQGAIKCIQLSSDHRLLDGQARKLILEEFIALPDEAVLLQAFDQQSGWEHEKTQVIKHEFKQAIELPSRGSSTNTAAFARPLSRETFTRSSVYIPTGAITQHGQFRPSVSWRHGRNGKHMAETDSQFAQRQAMTGTTKTEWEHQLSKCPGSREAIRPRRVATVPLAKSSAEIFAETFMTQTDTDRSVSAGELKRPPRPITPNDFGAGWLVDSTAAGRETTLGLKSQQSSGTDDTASDATFAKLVGEDNTIAVNEMWPDKTTRRLRRNPSHTSWGVRALAATGIASATEGTSIDLPAPEVKEGFDRLFLRRLVDATVQAAKKTKQTRSTQYYPHLCVLVADVVSSSCLQDCGPELSDILDNVFTQFKELAEGRYNSSTMWGKGRRFIALSGVQHDTNSSCIGSTDDVEQDEMNPDDSAMKAATWKERSFEASASYLEARLQTSLETEDPDNSSLVDNDKPPSAALDRLIQLACTMQRCIAHVNCAPNATKKLSVRIGIAMGPAVVGFYGLHHPFPYNCWGWTVDEAHRLENAAPSGSILVEASAYEAAPKTVSFEPQAAVGAIRGGDFPSPQFDYRVLGSDEKKAAGGPARSSSGTSNSKKPPQHKYNRGKATQKAASKAAAAGFTAEKVSDGALSGKENLHAKARENPVHWSRRPGCRTRSLTRVPLKAQASAGRVIASSTSSTHLNGAGTTHNFNSSDGRRVSGSWLPPVVQSTASAESLLTFAGEMFDRVEHNRSGVES